MTDEPSHHRTGIAPPESAQAIGRRAARIAHAYLVLPHAVPVIVVLATTAAFALIAVGTLPPPGALARLLGAMLGGQLAIGAVNEIVDAEIDARVKPSKPIPAGYVSIRGALVLAAVSLGAMVWLSAGFGFASLALCAGGTFVGIAYSLWFKRTLVAWLPYLVALPLLPIWVWTALTNFDARLLVLYPLGACAVFGVQLSQSLPDVAADRAAGIRNLTSLLGEQRAIAACWAATLTSALLAVVLAPRLTEDPFIAWIAAATVATLVALDVAAYRARPRLGVMACFPCIAASAAVMGIGWVLAVTR